MVRLHYCYHIVANSDSVPVIRVGLVVGKLSQTAQTLHVVRATPRAFEHEQWETLEKRLVAWKTGLASVLEVVMAAKKKSAPEVPTPAVVANGLETAAQPPQVAAA